MIQRSSRAACVLVAALAVSAPASAQVVHSIHIGGGGFFPRGADSRSADDVLVRNLFGQPMPADPSVTDALVFEIGDFTSGHVFGEWNVAFGPHIEVAGGLGFYGRSVDTFYRDVVNEFNQDIPQKLSLHVLPITGIVRFLPFGTPRSIQPYVGAGFAAVRYKYSEKGLFVDPFTLDIFDDHFEKSGFAPGGLFTGGVRFPIGGDVYGLGVEGRYLFATGETGGIEEGFVADKIDLSGGMFNVTFLVRF